MAVLVGEAIVVVLYNDGGGSGGNGCVGGTCDDNGVLGLVIARCLWHDGGVEVRMRMVSKSEGTVMITLIYRNLEMKLRHLDLAPKKQHRLSPILYFLHLYVLYAHLFFIF